MNTSGEVADLMVKESIQITEYAAKLAGLGAKNLAAIIIAIANDNNKLQGKTNLKQLLKSEKPLCILQIKKSDIHKFNAEAKRYGVLFTAVSDRTDKSGFCDFIAKQDDVTKLNYIIEKLGLTTPEIPQEKAEDEPAKTEQAKDETTKKSNPRTNESRSEKKYTEYGGNGKNADRRKSVKQKISEIKVKQKAKAGKSQERKRTVKDKSRG